MRSMKLAWVLLSMLAADAGVDAPVPAPAPLERWKWSHADGGWLDDAGVTDTLTMRVGEVGELQFPLPIMLMQCDEPLLTLEATLDTLLLKATATGHTRCGFWYRPQAWPHRTLDVVVTR